MFNPLNKSIPALYTIVAAHVIKTNRIDLNILPKDIRQYLSTIEHFVKNVFLFKPHNIKLNMYKINKSGDTLCFYYNCPIYLNHFYDDHDYNETITFIIELSLLQEIIELKIDTKTLTNFKTIYVNKLSQFVTFYLSCKNGRYFDDTNPGYYINDLMITLCPTKEILDFTLLVDNKKIINKKCYDQIYNYSDSDLFNFYVTKYDLIKTITSINLSPVPDELKLYFEHLVGEYKKNSNNIFMQKICMKARTEYKLLYLLDPAVSIHEWFGKINIEELCDQPNQHPDNSYITYKLGTYMKKIKQECTNLLNFSFQSIDGAKTKIMPCFLNKHPKCYAKMCIRCCKDKRCDKFRSTNNFVQVKNKKEYRIKN